MRKQGRKDVEKKLKMAKHMNKAAAALIAALLILMSLMIVNMRHLAHQYERLEENYVQLYEKMGGSEKTGGNEKTVSHDGKSI